MGTTRTADGVRIHHEVGGNHRGEPVLLVQGLGATTNGWWLQRLAFAPRHRTIAFDNRGTGASDKPRGRYSLDEMAEDAVAVLDATGIESAHVIGLSMGGVIAQLVALRHPERVRSLVLVSTACQHHQWRRELLAGWAATASEQGMQAVRREAFRWLVGPRSFRRFWPAVAAIGPLALRVPPYAVAAQIGAILDADDGHRVALPDLPHRALVVVGNQDILTPRGDSEELADLIPRSELAVISGAAHGLTVEHASTFNRLVTDFLGRPGRG
jgi:3-oxoadipate enol-lactonase